jgi:hypothetical protein
MPRGLKGSTASAVYCQCAPIGAYRWGGEPLAGGIKQKTKTLMAGSGRARTLFALLPAMVRERARDLHCRFFQNDKRP